MNNLIGLMIAVIVIGVFGIAMLIWFIYKGKDIEL